MSQSENAEIPKLNLPPPVAEVGASRPNNDPTVNPEQTNMSPEVGERTGAPVVSNPPIPQIPLPISLPDDTTTPAASTPTSTSISVPATADDNDLIEKEWVNKAKKIVKSNRDNPYNQTKELTAFKAEYMMKRYNKVIKISD